MKRRQLPYICLLFLLCGVTGCVKIYRMDLKKPTGEIVYTAEFESYAYGDQTYVANAEWYQDGKIKSMHIGFSRNISSLVGQVLDGLAEAVGAAGNKL